MIYISIRATEKPNFIIILADDLGYGDLGYTGSTQIKTPNIDNLAETGVVFTNGYVTSAVCSPSRAGLLTGRYNCEFGYYTNPDLPPDQQLQINRAYSGLQVDEVTIADRLAELGYFNGIIGKWHLGHLPQFHPLKRGFHEFWGYLNGGHDYFKTVPKSETKIRYRWPIECSYKKQGALTYITDDKGNECVDLAGGKIDKEDNIHGVDLTPFISEKNSNMPHDYLMWNMSCPEPLFFQGNEQKPGYRKLYDVVSPPQPGTIKKNITL
ncbi:hypothetical protein ES708_33163 [subsurface metagenome]